MTILHDRFKNEHFKKEDRSTALIAGLKQVNEVNNIIFDVNCMPLVTRSMLIVGDE